MSFLRTLGGMGMVGLSVAVFIAAFLLLQAVGAAQRPPEVELLAAARDLRPGEILAEQDLRTLRAFRDEAVEAFLPAEALSKTIGGLVAWPIPAGRPIPRDAVIASSGSRFAALLGDDPGYAALPLFLDAPNLIAPPPETFLPGDLVDLVVVVTAEPPRPEAVAPMPVPTPAAPGITGTAPITLRVPVGKSLFPRGARVLAVMVPSMDPESGMAGPGHPTLVLRIPAADLERAALLLRLADQVSVVHLGRGEGFPERTPAFTYDDFMDWLAEERRRTLESPIGGGP